MKKNNWIIGTFYTLDSPYESVFQQYLLPSLKKIKNVHPNIQWIVKTIKNNHSWLLNTAQKPLIIKEILQELNKDECLVFLDADATIEIIYEIFDEIAQEYDIAFHLLSWSEWYEYTESTIQELLSGTLFLRNNDEVKKLCEDWYQEAINTQEWEQRCLQRILPNHQVNVFNLPLQYCFMKTRPGGLEPLIKCEPVIQHNQVSRIYRK